MIRRICFPLVPVLVPFVAPAGLSAQTSPADSLAPLVVNIHTTHRFPDVFRPWTQSEAQKAAGSGAVIAGNRILTNAHVVRNASEIYVQPHQSSDMLEAKVVAFAPGIDLALIELEDPTFFASRGHVEFATELPKVKDKVSVYGYPQGGDTMSVTEGIVSRIEFTGYSAETAGLRVQVDAALNPGNSGGPAFANGRVIGSRMAVIVANR
jgi:S1-C subfamily serine protease